MSKRYEAKGDPFKGSVILHGRGVPSIFAQTYNLKDAEKIAAALNDYTVATDAEAQQAHPVGPKVP